MAEGKIAFSSGTVATAERQKPGYGRFIDDVRRGNLANLPDRLKDVVQRMQDVGGKAGAGAKINDVLAAFAGTGNQFVMNTASRLTEAAEAGVFGHPDAHKIMKELMLECPQAADSVPKMLADLKSDLGDCFYGLREKDITRIAMRSMRASGSHCPKEIHMKMAELTIRGEFDHIPQMHALRMEKAVVPERVAMNEFAAVAVQVPGPYAEFRPAQPVSDYSITSVAEKQILPKPMEFKAPFQMQNTNGLRNAPLAETMMQKDAVQRVPRAMNQPLAREPVLKAREEQRAPVKSAELQAKTLKQVVVPDARQQAPKESAREAQASRRIAMNTQGHVENKKEKRQQASQITVQPQQAAKPAPLRRLREKLRIRISRVRELARAAKNKIADKRAEAKKRRALEPAIAKRVPKNKKTSASAAAIAKKKAKIVLPLQFRMKKRKGHMADARKKTAPQARWPAMRSSVSRLPGHRGRGRSRFLNFLIAPGFFSFRRQRKNNAVRVRNHF